MTSPGASTTFCRDTPQYGVISFEESCLLSKYNPDEGKALPQAVNEILSSLNVPSTQEFCEQEKNSIFLSQLMTTHVKIESQGYIAWVHAADKAIRATNLFDPSATDSHNLGKRYFYDVTLHPSQKTDEKALEWMKQERKDFRERIQKIFVEQSQKIHPKEGASLTDRCWKFLRKNWDSFLRYLARAVFNLYEASQNDFEKK